MMQRNRARNWLIAATVLFAIGGLLSLLPAMMSGMMFDAPGSERNPATIAIFVSVISFPVVCVLSILVSWILYRCGRLEAALLASAAPLVNLLILAVALGCLNWLYGGHFGGRMNY